MRHPIFWSALGIFYLIVFPMSLLGQEKSPPTKLEENINDGYQSVFNEPPRERDVRDITGPTKVRIAPLEQTLSILILSFSFLVLSLELAMVLFNKLNPTQTVQLFGLTIIISSALFLITAGYSSDQIAPIMGLLGTVAGYLLGNANAKRP